MTIETRWVNQPRWPARKSPAIDGVAEPVSTPLVSLIRDSVRRGHSKVAMQRALMHQAIDGHIPQDLLAHLHLVWMKLKPAEQRRMVEASRSWAAMVTASRRPLH